MFFDFIYFSRLSLQTCVFRAQTKGCFFFAFCMWVGKGICLGRKLVIHMLLHVFQNFSFPFIIRFVEVESCWELCSLNGGVFSPTEFERPRSVSAQLFLGGSLFYFPGVVGGSLILLLDVASLLCLIKENRWVHVN